MSAERRRVLRLTHPKFLALILFLSLFSFVADLSATARHSRVGVADGFITKCTALCAAFWHLLPDFPVFPPNEAPQAGSATIPPGTQTARTSMTFAGLPMRCASRVRS